MPTIEALARLQVSTGRESKELPGWLDVIALQGETEQWREWARLQLAHDRHEPQQP